MPATGSACSRVSSASRTSSERRRDPGAVTALKRPLASSQRRSASSTRSAGGAVHSFQKSTVTSSRAPSTRRPRWSSPGAARMVRSSSTGPRFAGAARLGGPAPG